MTRRERRVDDSVLVLCRNYEFGGDPNELVLRLCRELLREAGMDVPTDLDVITSLRNVIRVEEVALDHDADLRWDGSHYVIGRRRLSTCHEVVHTFFPNARSRDEVLEREIGRSPPGLTEEHLCDQGAAELLMPAEPFRLALPSVPNMDNVLELAEIFGASIEAAARRALRLSGPKGAVVVLESKLKPKRT